VEVFLPICRPYRTEKYLPFIFTNILSLRDKARKEKLLFFSRNSLPSLGRCAVEEVFNIICSYGVMIKSTDYKLSGTHTLLLRREAGGEAFLVSMLNNDKSSHSTEQ
jgi:hypothetical protein